MDVFNPRRQKEKVMIVMGATGTGKSRLSIDLATSFRAEIINSDKMQVYKGLDKVTNKITKEEQRGVPHHLLGILDPNEDFTARDTSLAIQSVLGRDRLPIIVGVFNYYIEALVDDYDYKFRSKYECCFLWVDVSVRTLLSIDLATSFQAEIINSDKIQVYKGLDIVTNKITKEEQRGVPHHLLGILDANEDFTARDTSLAIQSVLGRDRLPIIVGVFNYYIVALDVSVPRVESLNKRLSVTHDKITTLEQMMCKISKGLLVHCYRYREIDPNIWISCTESLGVWIISYPPLFLQDVYLKYIGLALKDKRAGVRIAFVHALKNLREIDANVPSLDRFTRIFSSQMIALSGDIDISVAISATGPVKQLLRHQLLQPQIEYEHLIAQESNSSKSGAKGFSCYEHGTINIAYRWGNFVCVGVDSKLTDSLTGDVTNLNYNKFYQISQNIYITMAGFRMAWEEMFQMIASVFSTIPEESHRVELAANLAYQFVSPNGTVGSLVLGWDNTSPHPQMFRVIAGESLTMSDGAMAVGTGEQYINLRYLTDYYHGELAHAFQPTMLLLNQACILDRFCGGVVSGRVLQRDQPPSCQYLNFFN